MVSHIDKRIVAQAAKEFSRVGYHGVAMSELAKKAEVTEGSIFRIFRTKDALFELAVKHAILKVENEVSSIEFALTREVRFETALRNAVAQLLDVVTFEFARLRAFAVLERPELSPLFEQCVLAFEKVFAHAFEVAVAAGTLRDDLDPQVPAHHLVACVLDCKLFCSSDLTHGRSVTKTGKMSPSEKRRRAGISALVEIVLRGCSTSNGKNEKRNGKKV